MKSVYQEELPNAPPLIRQIPRQPADQRCPDVWISRQVQLIDNALGEISGIDIVGRKGVIAGYSILGQEYVHSTSSPIDILCGSLLQVFVQVY